MFTIEVVVVVIKAVSMLILLERRIVQGGLDMGVVDGGGGDSWLSFDWLKIIALCFQTKVIILWRMLEVRDLLILLYLICSVFDESDFGENIEEECMCTMSNLLTNIIGLVLVKNLLTIHPKNEFPVKIVCSRTTSKVFYFGALRLWI
ncbi:hypothetical protein ACJIZ3_018649 [Penstemon smallii]|uniref:Uncharacterized protein n=1 Tax=Penstemon smallii TaxID=265156 RepID=A0ABD3SYX9_9LAMI